MSAILAQSPEGLASFDPVAASSNATYSTWIYTGLPTAAPYTTVFYVGNDPVLYSEGCWIGIDAGTAEIQIYINATATTTVGSILVPGWHYLTYRRTGTLQEVLDFGVVICSTTYDMSAETHTDWWAGSDTSLPAWNPTYLAYTRAFTVAQSDGQIVLESRAPVAQDTANLWTDTPLLNDLLDDSGNGHDWTAFAGTITFGPQPLLVQPGVAAGWVARSQSASVSSTTGSITITKPAGTIDNDTLILCLSHRGASWATVPVGWNLAAQDLSGVVRGEMYWKRAASEGADYTIDDLGSVATGYILCYSGGKLTGDIVDIAVTRANASGAAGVGPWTPTGYNVLCIALEAVGANNNPGAATADAPSSVEDVDLDFSTFLTRMGGQTVSGGGNNLQARDKIKNIPSPLDGMTWSLPPAADNVGMIVTFLPEPTPLENARFYLTRNSAASQFLPGPVAGTWDQVNGPDAYGQLPTLAFLLDANKACAGDTNSISLSNADSGIDVCYSRWVTRPLAAQTLLGGTLTFCWPVRYSQFFGPAVFRTKIHAYISIGQTTQVRQLLIDNEVDSTNWTTSTICRQIVGTLPASAAIVAGDSVILEVGFSIVSATPNPGPPTLPAAVWTIASLQIGNTISNQVNGPALLDAVAGSSTIGAPWVEFSAGLGLTELAHSAPPSNATCATATVIASPFPYNIVDLDTTGAGLNRQVWYAWTAPADMRVIITVRGTNYNAAVYVFDPSAFGQTCGTFTFSGREVGITSRVTNFGTARPCQNGIVFDAIGGHTYKILVRQQARIADGNGGGALCLQFAEWQTLQPDDLYLPCSGVIIRLRDGVMVGWQPDLSNVTLSGIAIDYTKNPIVNAFNDPGSINTDYRILVSVFGSDIIEILDAETMNIGQFEIDYISQSGVLGTANSHLNSLDVDVNGVCYAGWFGDGYQLVANELSSFENEVSSGPACQVNVFPATHGDNQPTAPFPPAALLPVDPEKGGSDYTKIADAEGEIIWYSSSGQYVPLAGVQIQAYSVVGSGQIAPRVAALTSGTGPNPGPKGICPLPDGGVLVCNGSVVQRYNAGGAVIQTYTPTPAERAYTLCDVDLTNDGLHFWVLNSDLANLFKFNLASGAQELEVQTDMGTGNCTSIVIFRPDRFGPVSCPGILGPPRQDGLPYIGR